MTEKPLIFGVVGAENWLQAFEVLWADTFGRIAGRADMMMARIKWLERRPLCRALAEQCIEERDDEELAAAWFCLAIGPSEASDLEAAKPVLKALAKAIVADPGLLDDKVFARAVAGWRYFVNNPDDEIIVQDVIEAAPVCGANLQVEDRVDTLKWARHWVQ